MCRNNSVTSRVKKASCENNFDLHDNECARATQWFTTKIHFEIEAKIFKGAMSCCGDLKKCSLNFSSLSFVISVMFSIFNHPCSFMVYVMFFLF